MKLENMDTRWNRIERKHINAVKLHSRSEAAADICKNLLKSKNFIRDHHMKYLLGDKSNDWYLDPNLVMDLRHRKVKLDTSMRFIAKKKILYFKAKFP